jgi:hypothetical protein
MKHPLAGLMRTFAGIEDKRVIVGATRPSGCRGFTPHANPRMTGTCVRCGRKREHHE